MDMESLRLRAPKEYNALKKLLDLARENRRRSYKKILSCLIKEGLTLEHADIVLARLISKGILRKKGTYYHQIIFEIDPERLEEYLYFLLNR
jgi:hypothetical protein